MYTFHGGGVQTAIKAGKRIRVMTTFSDGVELAEEYDEVTQNLECRRWRSSQPLGGTGAWAYEIGDPVSQESSLADFSPSSLNPSFHPRDTPKAWEWHIRNLPYPKETYRLDIDTSAENNQGCSLVLRTTNKKYFKRFKVPALVRTGLPLKESNASFSHDGGSTLTLTYIKPREIIEEERKARARAKELVMHSGGIAPPSGDGNGSVGGEQPPDCKQS